MSAPAYVLTPEPDGSAKVWHVPRDRSHVLWQTEPLPPWFGVLALTEIRAVSIAVVRYGEVRVFTRSERRRRARARGRRRSVAVPVAEQREVRIAAHPDVPAAYVRRFAEANAEVVEREWARR